MDEHTKLGLITAVCAIVGILFLLFIVWKCCYKDGRLILPCMGEERLLPSESNERVKNRGTKRDFLIKRCDQETTRKVEDRIIERLQRDYNVVERPWDKNLDDRQQPVIVFCVISSRIGTDIDNAMKGVYDGSRVILVILHYTMSTLLRGDLSDEEELLETTMKNRMTGIAHFAFSDGEGLYNCHQNSDGFNKLASIVKSFS